MLRNFAKANEAIDRAIALDPTAFEPWEVKSKLALFEKGDFSVAEKAFEALKSAPMTNEQRLNAANARANVFLLERKYREGLQEAENLPDDQVAAFPGHLWSKYYYIGFARKALQDEAGARAAFLQAKSVIEEQLKGRPVPRICIFSWQECSRISAKRLPRRRRRNARLNCFLKARMHLVVPKLRPGWLKFTRFSARTIARLQFWMDCLAGQAPSLRKF